jgi:NodT family efflux transporter outer membrane factor (OMF) lipoprotein
MKILKRTACLGMLTALSACSTLAPPASVPSTPPPQWYAPLPHDGKLTDLSQWWQQQGDPLLVRLIEAAQAVSPSIAAAHTRIEQSRATRVAAGAALLPTLNATASATRTSPQPPLQPMGTTVTRGLQAAWEVDVFGANWNSSSAAQARLNGARAGWHEARVSVAAEVAGQYYDLRACEKLAVITRSDATSRAETARLADLSTKAGFQAPATSALARASAAEGNARATQQRAQCDINLKSLVALTAIAEPELRQKLGVNSTDLPEAGAIAIDSLPARILAQRPDVYAAENEVAAASGDVRAARADLFPRLTLSGSIGKTSFRSAGSSADLDTWSIGPLALTLPIFDGGRRLANVDAAQARYEEAAIQYRAKVRQAVREVEEALINLQSTAARGEDARVAVEGYRASFGGTEARYGSGLASLVELEDARRVRLAAEVSLVSLQRERLAAWIALYRAAGGGWSRDKASGDVAITATATAANK